MLLLLKAFVRFFVPHESRQRRTIDMGATEPRTAAVVRARIFPSICALMYVVVWVLKRLDIKVNAQGNSAN